MFVVIAAGGSSNRFGGSTPKQFLSVDGKTIIEYAVQPFLNHPAIKQIVIVLSQPCHYWEALPIAKHPKILLAQGGEQRVDSVLNALSVLSDRAKDDDWVLVHDAARPCFTEQMLQKLIAEIGDHETGGLLAVSVRDTLKKADKQEVITVDRSHLWQAQTPQMFRYGKLKKALSQHKNVTDDAQALEKMGEQVKLVEGDLTNFKVTTQSDFELAKIILRGRDGY